MGQEKDNGIWTNRPAVQKAFDKDPQMAYYTVAAVLTQEQAAIIESLLVPSTQEQLNALLDAKSSLEALGVDTAAVDAKILELNG